MAKIKTATESNTNQMEPDLLHAARFCDFEEAKVALINDPSCIYNCNVNKMNALQLAICEFHEDMALFLLDNCDISAQHKDVFGRDALDLAIQIGSDKLAKATDDRWREELRDKLANPNKVSSLNLSPK